MSIASRIESIEEHIGNAYDSIEALGVDITDIDKNIENISSSIDGIYDTLPKVTDEGESITLDGTIKGRLKSTLKGNTSQNGTPTPSSPIPVNVVSGDNSVYINGKNIFNNNATALKVDRITYSTITNGLKFHNGASNTYGSVVIEIGDISRFLGKTLTFSMSSSASSNFRSFGFVVCNSDGSNISQIGADMGGSNTSFTRTIGDTYTQTKLGMRFYLSNISDNTDYVVNNIQIEENTTKTDFQPYTGATYPINLPVENLINLEETPDYVYGNTNYTQNGTIFNIKNNNTSGGTRVYSALQYYINGLKPSTQYTISFKAQILGNSIISLDVVNTRSDLGTASNRLARIDGTSVTTVQSLSATFTTPADTSQLSFVMYGLRGTYYDNANTQYWDIMIEEGSKANSYTPYGTTSIELCNIPNTDYQDYFYKDNGNWYLNKYIGKYTFTGNETPNAITGGYFYSSSVFGAYIIGGYNTKFEFINDSRVQGNDGAMVVLSNNQMCFRLGNTKDRLYIKTQLSESDLKSTIANTPLYYVLATPTSTQITYQPLIEQLNNIEKAMSYNGQTNISQVNNDLPFIISASALKEWQESNVSTLSMSSPLSLGNTLNTQEIDLQPIEIDNIEPLEEGEYE